MRIKGEIMICPKCAKQIPENSVFCNYCGEQINRDKVSLIRLIKNVFAIVIFVIAISSLFIPYGSTNSKAVLSKLGYNTNRVEEISINYSLHDILYSITYLNDEETKVQVQEEIFRCIESKVSSDTYHKFRYTTTPLSKDELRELKQAFTEINPFLYLSVSELRTNVPTTILLGIAISFIVMISVLFLGFGILMSAIDLKKPRFNIFLRKVIMMNFITSMALIFLVAVFNQMNSFKLGPASILYISISGFGFLVVCWFRVLKNKSLSNFNLRLFIKNFVRSGVLIIVALVALGTVVQFRYTYTSDQGVLVATNDNEGVASLFSISNYINIHDSLHSVNDLGTLADNFNGMNVLDVRSDLKDINSLHMLVTSNEFYNNNNTLFYLNSSLPIIILVILVLTLVQLMFSLNNLYYEKDKFKKVNVLFSTLKIALLAYIIIVSIATTNAFNTLKENELIVYTSFDISLNVGLYPVVASVLSLSLIIFTWFFKAEVTKAEQ